MVGKGLTNLLVHNWERERDERDERGNRRLGRSIVVVVNIPQIITVVEVVLLDQGSTVRILTIVASVGIPDTIGIQMMTLVCPNPPGALLLAWFMVLALDQSRLVQLRFTLLRWRRLIFLKCLGLVSS